jgi:hypothetical protein
VVTNNDTDLLVGADTVQTLTTGAGGGFRQRLLTNPNGNIAEDQNVTVAGCYTATAPLDSAGESVMQTVAFRRSELGLKLASNDQHPPTASRSRGTRISRPAMPRPTPSATDCTSD